MKIWIGKRCQRFIKMDESGAEVVTKEKAKSVFKG